MSGVVVFLGPSLPLDEARRILDATYLPPVAMGDVLRALSSRPRGIAIIDGFFERVPAVWHKEILLALTRGTHVFGAASMGALRAAELASFGVRGVGRIFEDFRDGNLTDDDEVAVAHAHAEHGFRPLSDAMVSLRAGLRRAAREGWMGPASAALLEARAKGQFYPDRSWAELLSTPCDGVPVTEQAVTQRNLPAPPDAKRADAIALLEHLRDHLPTGPFEATFTLEPSTYLRRALEEEGAAGPGGVAHVALGRHVRMRREDRQDLLRAALHAGLVIREAERLGLHLDGAPTGSGSFSATPSATLDGAELARLIAVAEARLVEAAGSQLDPYLSSILRQRAEIEPELAHARRKRELVGPAGVVDLERAGVDLQALSDWYEQRFGTFESDVEVHLRERGFASWHDFMLEIFAEFLAEKALGEKR